MNAQQNSQDTTPSKRFYIVGFVISCIAVPVVTIIGLSIYSSVMAGIVRDQEQTVNEKRIQDALATFQANNPQFRDANLQLDTYSNPQTKWYIAQADSIYKGKKSRASALLYNHGEAVVAHMVVDHADEEMFELELPVSVPIKVQRTLIEALQK